MANKEDLSHHPRIIAARKLAEDFTNDPAANKSAIAGAFIKMTLFDHIREKQSGDLSKTPELNRNTMAFGVTVENKLSHRAFLWQHGLAIGAPFIMLAFGIVTDNGSIGACFGVFFALLMNIETLAVAIVVGAFSKTNRQLAISACFIGIALGFYRLGISSNSREALGLAFSQELRNTHFFAQFYALLALTHITNALKQIFSNSARSSGR